MPAKTSKPAPTFEDLALWAKDDSFTLEREAYEAVKSAIDQCDVKLRVMAMVFARKRIQDIARVASQLDNIETILFDPNRVRFMNNGHLIDLYRVMSSRQDKLVDSYTNMVLDPKHVMPPPTDGVRKALEADDPRPQDFGLPAHVDEALVQKIGVLADKVSRHQNGRVTDPPAFE